MFKMFKTGMLASVALLTLLAVFSPVTALAGDEPMKAVAEDGILVFQSPDGEFKWWWDARVYLDLAGYIEDKNHLSNGFMVRRARWAMKTQIWTDWYAEVDFDFAEEATALKDAYISYRGLCNSHVRVGNFRQPFGLEENLTSRNLLFMERSQGTDPFAVGRRMGLEYARWGNKYRVAASVFGADVEDFNKKDDETFDVAARVNYTPILTEDSVLHLGASGSYRQTDFNSGKVRFKAKPESNVADVKYVDTGDIKNVSNYSLFAGEMAYVNKRFYAQTEYTYTDLNRVDVLENLNFGGGYLSVSYFLTDDTHPYDAKNAEFGRVVPSCKNGALELTARFSSLDMDDDTVDSDGTTHMYGTSTSMTFGVNYYANANIRMYLNYGLVNNDESANSRGAMAGDDDFSYIQMRFLAAF